MPTAANIDFEQTLRNWEPIVHDLKVSSKERSTLPNGPCASLKVIR